MNILNKIKSKDGKAPASNTNRSEKKQSGQQMVAALQSKTEPSSCDQDSGSLSAAGQANSKTRANLLSKLSVVAKAEKKPITKKQEQPPQTQINVSVKNLQSKTEQLPKRIAHIANHQTKEKQNSWFQKDKDQLSFQASRREKQSPDKQDLKKILELSKKYRPPCDYRSPSKIIIKNQPKVDARSKPASPRNHGPAPESMPKNYKHMLQVKKGYVIGKICVLEGYLEKKTEDLQAGVRLRHKEPDKVVLSCRADLVPNAESISHVFLRGMLEVGEREFLMVENDLIKVLAKSNNLK